jgi:hypothetical protein
VADGPIGDVARSRMEYYAVALRGLEDFFPDEFEAAATGTDVIGETASD